MTRMLSTDAQTAQEALLPQPSYGTVNVYTLSFPPDLTNLKNTNEKNIVSINCSVFLLSLITVQTSVTLKNYAQKLMNLQLDEWT